MIQHVRAEFPVPFRPKGMCLPRYHGRSGLRYGQYLRYKTPDATRQPLH